jgi:hypothetical protein
MEADQKKLQAISTLIVAITGLIALYAVASRLLQIGCFCGFIGKEETESAIIKEMDNGKYKEFKMTGLGGQDFDLIPRNEHFRMYHVGDTIQVKRNSILPNLAYIGNNSHLIVQGIITMGFWIFMFGFTAIQTRRSAYIQRFKAKMFPKPKEYD